MKRKTIIAVTTATVIGISAATISTALWAKGNHGERMINRITKVLSLDEGQVESLKALQVELKETRELALQDKSGFIDSLSEMVSAETFDQQRALDMINQRTEAVQANAPDVVNAAAVFFDGLTAEQKEQLDGKMQKMLERHNHRGRH